MFFVDDDRLFYLELLKQHAQKGGLEINGYCLMTNHIHLIATPRNDDSLAKTLGKVNFLYTRHINHSQGRSGHLWQGRFFSCPLDKYYYFRALRSVERHPVRAKMCRCAWSYPFSSASAHIGRVDKSGLLNLAKWRKQSADMDWKRELSTGEDRQERKVIKKSCLNGRPLGSDRFISRLERLVGSRLRARPVGRPRKTAIKPKTAKRKK
ncbi:MAG: transposase [Planctomycetota bacterium]